MNSPDVVTPWLAPLGWLALEAAVVTLAALALQPLLRTATTRRSLWRAVLVALALLLAAELTGTGSQLPAQLRLAWQTTFPQPPPAAPAITAPAEPPPISDLRSPIPSEPLPDPLPFFPEPLPEPPPTPSLHHSITPPPPPPVWPAFLWLAGLAALLARAAWTHAGFAWLRLRHFIPATEALRQRVQNLATRLGLRRRVRVLASERLRAPAAFGWVRPGVAVPGDFTARFAPAQQDVMLAHELAHLAARDPLWQLLADLAAAALWWHPLAWVARRQHRLAGELAADDASQALPDGPVVLAECLLALGHEAAAAPRAALGMAGFRSQLGRRVERLVALPRADWQSPSRLRLALQTTVALLALAALALLPGCAANRAESEPPSRLVAKWWQAKSKTPETQPRGATLLIQPKPKPVIVQGRVSFNGTLPPERGIPLPAPVLAARTNAPLKTRFHRVSPDGGLADVLVYVKSGLEGQTFDPPTNTHLIRIQRHEYQPYITAAQVGQPIRWETDVNLNFHPTPTNRANREFNRTLDPGRPIEATFTAPEFFLRTKDDVHPWLFGYVSILPHPFFAVTDAEGRFRFPQPLPPGKYTLAAVHRQAGTETRELVVDASFNATKPIALTLGAVTGRDAILRKLAETRLPEVTYDGLPLPEVLKFLSYDTKKSDPERRGVHFALSKSSPNSAAVDLETVLIKVSTVLRDVSVLEALDAILKTADAHRPTDGQFAALEYHIESDRVVFRERTKPVAAVASAPAALTPRQREIRQRLETVVLPSVQYHGLPLTEVIKMLAQDARRHDPEKRGFNLLLSSTGQPGPAEQQVDLDVVLIQHPDVRKNATMREVLDAICHTAEVKRPDGVPAGLKYSVEGFGILFTPDHSRSTNAKPVAPPALVPPHAPLPAATTPTPAPPVAGRPINAALAREHCDRLEALVKTIRANPATTAQDYANVAGLIEQALTDYAAVLPPTAPELTRLKKLLEETNALTPKPKAEAAPSTPVAADVRRLTSPQTPDARPQTPPTSQSLVTSAATNAAPLHHQPTVEKLARIRLPEVTYDGLPLSEVLKFLQSDTKKYDPDKAGVDFGMRAVYEAALYDEELGAREISEPFRPLDVTQPRRPIPVEVPNPAAAPPLPRARIRQVAINDMDRVPIHVSTVLRDVSVLDALDAIVKTAGSAIGYTVETNRVVIRPRLPGHEFKGPRVGINAPGAALRALAEKMVFPSVIYDGLPLPEVVKFLTADARKHDPEKRGVNFLVTSHYPGLPQVLPDPAAPLVDPQGHPIPPDPRLARPDLDVVLIRFAPEHHNLTLRQTLDAICAHAELPNGFGLTYRFEDYGVVITPRYPAPPAAKPAEPRGALPAPAPSTPVAADVRRLQSNAEGGARNAESSQSLLTSAATNSVTPTPDPLQAAQEEAVRRQERRLVLDKLLAEAMQFQKIKSWTNAVVRYEEAFTLAKGLGGPAVERQSGDALAGLKQCRLQLAIALQEKYEFKAATAEADKILPFDPQNTEVEQFKRFNERVEAAHKNRPARLQLSAERADVMRLVRDGQMYYQMGDHPKARTHLEEAIAKDPVNEAAYFYLRLVQEAQFEIEGKAREKHYGERVVAVTQKWNEESRGKSALPVPNPYHRTNSQVPFLTHSSKGAQRINRKLEEIVLPEVHFDAVPLVGVVQRLIEDAKKFDPEKKGLNFLINDVSPAAPLLDAAGNPVPVARPVALSEGLVRVSQPLKNLTLRQALDVICKSAELPTQFSVEEYAIAFIPRGPVAYYSRMFRVNPDTFIQGLQGVVGNPVLGAVGQSVPAAGQAGQVPSPAPAAPVRATVPATVPATQRTAAEANALVRQFFQSAGVTALGATNGSTRVTFNPENGLLLVRGTTNELRLLEQAIQKVQPVGTLLTNTVPQANPAARTNAPPQRPAHSSKGAQRINAKLDEIILPEIHFDSVSLPAVVTWLDGNVKKHDPEKKGLNFLINNVVSDYISPKAAAPLLDPKSSPVPPAAAPAVKPDLQTALIKVPAALKDLSLRQALDVICKTAAVRLPDGRIAGLKFSVEEYAIVFSPKLPEQADLFSRIFKVDPETFITGLGSVVDEREVRPGSRAALNQALRERAWTNAPAGTNRLSVAGVSVAKGAAGVVNTNVTAELNHLVRHYFTAAGVANLGATNGPDATQVFLNDRNGLLLVRASLQDLEIIQQAVELLNAKPARVKFDVTAFETGPTTERPAVSVRVVTAEEAKAISQRLSPAASRQSDLVVTVPMFQSARVPLFSQRNTNGPSLQVLPISEREQGLQITVLTDHASLPRRFSGVNMNAREIYDYVPVPGQAPPRPAVREEVKQPVNIVTVPFGHVVVVTANTAATGAPSGSAPSAGYTILLSPTLVSPAGHRVHTDAVKPLAPAAPAKK